MHGYISIADTGHNSDCKDVSLCQRTTQKKFWKIWVGYMQHSGQTSDMHKGINFTRPCLHDIFFSQNFKGKHRKQLLLRKLCGKKLKHLWQSVQGNKSRGKGTRNFSNTELGVQYAPNPLPPRSKTLDNLWKMHPKIRKTNNTFCCYFWPTFSVEK